jgi:hypothetical protein
VITVEASAKADLYVSIFSEGSFVGLDQIFNIVGEPYFGQRG